jgi:hypothetical protein
MDDAMEFDLAVEAMRFVGIEPKVRRQDFSFSAPILNI